MTRIILFIALAAIIAMSVHAGQDDTSVNTAPTKYGFIDMTGKVVIPARFDDVGDFSEGLAPAFFTGKWGFIDKAGNWAIEPRFNATEPFHNGLALVASGAKFYVIDKSGKTIRPAKGLSTTRPRNELHYVQVFRRGESLYGFADDAGKMIIKPKFTGADDFSEGLAPVGVKDENLDRYIDEKGQVVLIPKWQGKPLGVGRFSEGLAVVCRINYSTEGGMGHGVIDRKGRVIVPPTYTYIAGYSEGLAAVSDGSKFGYLDRSGKIVIPMKFDEAREFCEGVAQVKVNEKWGFIDRGGKQIIEPKYDDEVTYFEDGLAVVRTGKHSDYIDKAGKTVVSVQPEDAWDFGSFHEGLAHFATYGKAR